MVGGPSPAGFIGPLPRPHRLRDVLHLLLAQVLERKIQPAADDLMNDIRDADAARRGQALETRRDVDAVAVDVVAVDDHVAKIDADAEHDALLFRQLGLPLGDALLNGGSAFDRIHHASEFDQRAVAHELDDAAVELRDLGRDEVPAQRLEARVRALLIGCHESAVADDVRSKDSGKSAFGSIFTHPGCPFENVGRIHRNPYWVGNVLA
jgi:hypothetical protein